MKNTIRASYKNGNKPASAQLKKPTIPGQNASPIGQLRDPELAKECDKMNAEKRLALAKKLEKWTRELRRSVPADKQGGLFGLSVVGKLEEYAEQIDLIEKFRSLPPSEGAVMLYELWRAFTTILAEAKACGRLKGRLLFVREFEGWAAKLKHSNGDLARHFSKAGAPAVTTASRAVGEILDFTPAEVAALEAIAKNQTMTAKSFCQYATLYILRRHMEWLKGHAIGKTSPQVKRSAELVSRALPIIKVRHAKEGERSLPFPLDEDWRHIFDVMRGGN